MPRLRRDKVREAYDALMRDRPEAIAVDTETTGFSWYDEAFCMTVAWEGEAHYLDLDDCDARSVAKHMLRTPKLVFHNAKFDLCKLINAELIKRSDLTAERIEDTECAAHLLNPHSEKKLKKLAEVILGLTTDEAKALAQAKKEFQRKWKKEHGTSILSKDIGYHQLPRRAVYPYAIKDAVFTWELWKKLKPQIKGTLAPLYDREMELTLVLLDIEARGMAVDMEYVNREIRNINSKILSCELLIADQTGLKVWYPERSGQQTPEGSLNPNSPVQMVKLFEDRGITLTDTKGATLTAIDDELAASIISLRGFKKLLGTYLLAIKNEQRDGIIHPSYMQHRPKTGRMSSAAQSGD